MRFGERTRSGTRANTWTQRPVSAAIQTMTVDAFVLGGGGGGWSSGNSGGGGGAGAYRLLASQTLITGKYNITIGGGGASQASGTATKVLYSDGTTGFDDAFGLVADGGGAGNALNGGSGGGSIGDNSPTGGLYNLRGAGRNGGGGYDGGGNNTAGGG